MIVEKWHSWVNQPKKPKAWHENDITDELQELKQADGWINRWSEASDVVYTVTRARWSGHKFDYPVSRLQISAGFVYMYPKYSLRVLFFRRAGKKAGTKHSLQSVRNPKKIHKLEEIAKNNQIDPKKFIKVCQDQLKHWPLLP